MSLNLEYSLGFKNNVLHSLVFYDDTTVLFNAGRICVTCDVENGTQKQFPFLDNVDVTAFIRYDVLILIALKGKPPSVCVFNTLSETKKFYDAPAALISEELVCISVSTSLKFLAATSGPPDWSVIIWLSSTRNVVATFNPTVGKPGAVIHDISFHDVDREELMVVGKNIFRLYENDAETETEITFSELIFEKHEDHDEYFSICWPFKENLAVGTSRGEILFFRGIDQIYEISLIDVIASACPEKVDLLTRVTKSIKCLIADTEWLICSFADEVAVILAGEDLRLYKLRNLVFLPQDVDSVILPGTSKADINTIQSLALNHSATTLVGVTSSGQLISSPCSQKDLYLHFNALIQKQHGSPIVGLGISRSRPLLASCSSYRLGVWNFEIKQQEIWMNFEHEILCLAIHPFGFYIALGFHQYCRVLNILHRSVDERRLISFKNASCMSFSSGGHVLALAGYSVIELISFADFTLLIRFHGHAGWISSLAWKHNDTKLLSCDVRGVLCEWNVLTLSKSWEDTDPLSYHDLAVNPTDGRILVSGSDKTIKCFNDAVLIWKMQQKTEAKSIVVSSDGTLLYVGTTDGTLEIISRSESGKTEASGIRVHNGEVTALRLSYDYKFLFSAGSDGIIFCWKTSEDEFDEPPGAFRNLVMVSESSLQEQHAKIRELRMSLQHLKTESEYELQMSGINHEEYMKRLSQEHEAVVDALNNKISEVKEEMQIFTFDSEPPQDVQELETAKRKEVVDYTLKLKESYDRSKNYEEETEIMIKNYESVLRNLEEEQAKICTDDIDRKTDVMAKIKTLEESIMNEKNSNREIEKVGEVYRNSIQSDVRCESYEWTDSQKELIERERQKTMKLEEEVRKSKLMVSFQKEFTEKKRQILSGGIDYDINEMKHGISVLMKDVQALGDVLETKKKVDQTQEAKFFDARTVVKNIQQCHSVANTKVEELGKVIRSREQELDACVKEIKAINRSVPEIEQEIRIEKDLCGIVTEKVSEAMTGFRKKQRYLRDCEDVIKKYASLLSKCTSEECDPIQLREDIIKVFEQGKIGSAVDEQVDPSLQNEFEHQLQKLQSCYEDIKNEPKKAMIESATAEFRLSQENSKLLHEVHDVQKEVEKWAGILSEMELLGLPAKRQARASKQMEELRHKIEFVIEETKRDGRLREIAKLDGLIKEQQKEIQRFQTMLVAKEKAVAGKAGKKLKELMRNM